MKRIILMTFTAVALVVCFVSCQRAGLRRERETWSMSRSLGPDPDVYEKVARKVGEQFGLDFRYVPESSFTFNEAHWSGRIIDGSNGGFQVVQGDFYLSETITPKKWKQMTGHEVGEHGLSWDDIQKGLDKMYKNSSRKFGLVLPTEAMYEAAVEQGIIDPLAGTMELVRDRFCDDEKGLKDSFVLSETYGNTILCLPVNYVCVHGNNSIVVCRKPFERIPVERYRKRTVNAFRVALMVHDTDWVVRHSNLLSRMDPRADVPYMNGYDGKPTVFHVDGVSFKMLPVDGGIIKLGGFGRQEKYAEDDEWKGLEVDVNGFKMGETEVTCALWRAVMGGLPAGNDPTKLQRPVVGVSWFDAQEFIIALNRKTGAGFRLPTEYEWEYAARGGKKTHEYLFAGSDNAKAVAVCTDKSSKSIIYANVASKSPNELGLYDMSGNVWEWVRGQYEPGSNSAVLRGGSRKSINTSCRVSNRMAMVPAIKMDTFGFRLAL